MRALKLTIVNTIILCMVILFTKIAFRVFNIGFLNMMIYWITLVVVFAIANYSLNYLILNRLAKKENQI